VPTSSLNRNVRNRGRLFDRSPSLKRQFRATRVDRYKPKQLPSNLHVARPSRNSGCAPGIASSKYLPPQLNRWSALWILYEDAAAFYLRLPHAESRFAKTNGQFHFHVASTVIGHRVIHFVELRQQPQSELLYVSIGFNARLVFIEARIRIESGHADVDAWLAGNVVGVGFLEPRLVENVFRQFNHVNVIVRVTPHGIQVKQGTGSAE
jgi:hypothetical protein